MLLAPCHAGFAGFLWFAGGHPSTDELLISLFMSLCSGYVTRAISRVQMYEFSCISPEHRRLHTVYTPRHTSPPIHQYPVFPSPQHPATGPSFPNIFLISPANSSGLSQAAKCPPLSCSLQNTTGPNNSCQILGLCSNSTGNLETPSGTSVYSVFGGSVCADS